MSLNLNRVNGPIPGLDYLSGELPAELVYMVAQRIRDPGDHPQVTLNWLHNLALTCRRLNQIVEPILYQENGLASDLLATGLDFSTPRQDYRDYVHDPDLQVDGPESRRYAQNSRALNVKLLRNYTFPALSWGAYRNSIGTMRKAIANGARVDAVGRHPRCFRKHGERTTRYTRSLGCAIHFASFYGHDEAATLLIEHGASLEIGSIAVSDYDKNLTGGYAMEDYPHWLPLHHALSEGHESTAKLLLDHGAPLTVFNNRTKEDPLPVIITGPSEVKPNLNTTPNAIHEAATFGMHGLLEDLQARWLEVCKEGESDPRETFKSTCDVALKYAVDSSEMNTETVEALVKLGANVKGNYDVLYRTVRRGYWDIAIALVDAGADVVERESLSRMYTKDERGGGYVPLLAFEALYAPWGERRAEFFEKAFIPHRESLRFDTCSPSDYDPDDDDPYKGQTVLVAACRKLVDKGDQTMSEIIRFVTGDSLCQPAAVERQDAQTGECPLQILLNGYLKASIDVVNAHPTKNYNISRYESTALLTVIREEIKHLLKMGAKLDKLLDSWSWGTLKIPLQLALDFLKYSNPRLKVYGLKLLFLFRRHRASFVNVPESVKKIKIAIRSIIKELRQPSASVISNIFTVENHEGHRSRDDYYKRSSYGGFNRLGKDNKYGEGDETWVEWGVSYRVPGVFRNEMHYAAHMMKINCHLSPKDWKHDYPYCGKKCTDHDSDESEDEYAEQSSDDEWVMYDPEWTQFSLDYVRSLYD